MKVSIEIDLTPQEARELLGMPNLTAVQDVFVGMAKDKLATANNLVDLEPMIKTWTGIGGVATDALGALMGAALKVATSDSSSKPTNSASAEKPKSDKTS
jgi:hypothetical protein